MKSTKRNVTIGVLMGVLIGFVCGVSYINSDTAEALSGEKAAGNVIILPYTQQDARAGIDSTIEKNLQYKTGKPRDIRHIDQDLNYNYDVIGTTSIVERLIQVGTLVQWHD